MTELLNVEVSFVISGVSDGKQKAKISVEYNENDWADVLALEKLLIPTIVEQLLAAGEVYNAAQGLPPVKLTP